MEKGTRGLAETTASLTRTASAALAIFAGTVMSLFAFMVFATAPFQAYQLVPACAAAAFLAAGIVAVAGGSVWFLRAVWSIAIAVLVYDIVAANVGMGLFEGGAVILMMLFYLGAGLTTSLFARARTRSAK